jgi:ABC-type proline/glycine betaine transport system permease subunit
MKMRSTLSNIGLAALTQMVPVPGLGLLLHKGLRRKARKATGIALLGAGALVAVPVALYVICKTSGESTSTN